MDSKIINKFFNNLNNGAISFQKKEEDTDICTREILTEKTNPVAVWFYETVGEEKIPMPADLGTEALTVLMKTFKFDLGDE